MRSLFFLFPTLLFLGLNASADSGTELTPPTDPNKKKETVMFEQTAQAISAGVQKQIAKAADLLDVELAGQRYVTSRNPSHVNLSELEIIEEGRGVRSAIDFGLNLRLPNTEKRWALRFSSYDENAEERDLNQRTVRTTPRVSNPGTALILFKKLGRLKTSFQPRLQFKDPLYTNYTFRLESDAKAGNLRMNPMMELFADSLKGTGEYLSLEIGYRPDGGHIEFIFDNDEQYQQNANDFLVDHGFITVYNLSDTRTLGAAVIFTSENHPYHLNSMTYSTSFTQDIFPKILKMILSPYWSFSKGYNFKGFVGVSLNTEIVF